MKRKSGRNPKGKTQRATVTSAAAAPAGGPVPPGPWSGTEKTLSVIILLAAALFRFAQLTVKPVHFDEGINGFFVNQMWEKGYFTYDPSNYHGPLLFYLFQMAEKVLGFGVFSFRAVTALFSLLTVWLVLRARDLLGRYASFFIAAVLALSPGMIFFGRSAIHEAVFVFFQVLWIVGFVRVCERRSREGMVSFLAGLVGCALLKETFVILGVAFVLAWAWAVASSRLLGSAKSPADDMPLPAVIKTDRDFLLKALSVSVFVWLAFYTGFFQHGKGARDFFVALVPWLKTGVSATGHEKPFGYWLRLFARYEWVALAGLAGAVAGIVAKSWKMRFFSMLTLANWLVYSFIPYKTPWCVISILWPPVVVAGLWVEAAVSRRRSRDSLAVAASAVTLAVLLASSWRSYDLNYRHYADGAEPYVYVQTKKGLSEVTSFISGATEREPRLHNMKVRIALKDAWPVSWIFSRFPNLEYGGADEPLAQGPDVIFAEEPAKDQALAGAYWMRKMELRDAREPIRVYLKAATFAGTPPEGFVPVSAGAQGT